MPTALWYLYTKDVLSNYAAECVKHSQENVKFVALIALDALTNSVTRSYFSKLSIIAPFSSISLVERYPKDRVLKFYVV